jgi:serine/threonine-protein kinase
MGSVFLAEQIALGNRHVALKVLLRKLLDDPEFLMRFYTEASAAARIHHPNVVTIYESGHTDDGTPYIAMEYLDGDTLREMLKNRGALPLDETVEIVQQVARGLNAAHKLGIIHRDLKPDNIFLTRSDEGDLLVKVVDFGIAKLREAATHTLTGTVLGTPAYMSFEQASGMRSEELDARSDIYSFGVVVYEMLTGRVPFHSDTPLGYVRKHLTEEPPPFRAINPDSQIPPAVESVVMKALRKEREKRHAGVADFAHELREAAEVVRIATTKLVTPSKASSEPVPPAPQAGGEKTPKEVRRVSPAPVHDRPEPLQKDARGAGQPAASLPIGQAAPRVQASEPAKLRQVPHPAPPSRPEEPRTRPKPHITPKTRLKRFAVFLVLALLCFAAEISTPSRDSADSVVKLLLSTFGWFLFLLCIYQLVLCV